MQQAMALAGHKDTRTHRRYVGLSPGGPLETPEAALPALDLFLPLLGTNSLSCVSRKTTIRLFLLVTPTRIELVLSA